MSLTLRNTKGTALTYTELDNNFIYLSQSIVSSSVAGGNDYNILYNENGIVTGSDELIWDYNSKLLNISVSGSSALTITNQSNDSFITINPSYFKIQNSSGSYGKINSPTGISNIGDLVIPNTTNISRTIAVSVNSTYADSTGSITLTSIPTASYLNTLNQNLTITGSVTVTSVLTLKPQSPLPAGSATGSFAVSSSVPPKPYFWDGTSWNALY